LDVLEALSQCTDPARTTEIGASIGETPLSTGHNLFELSQGGLAEKPNKEESLWLLTDKGREAVVNPPSSWVRNLTEDTQGDTRGETRKETRADLFRTEG